MRVLALIVIAFMFLPAVARAADEPRVVVVPFVTTDPDLMIYGKPVADAVARGLRDGGGPPVVEKTPAELAVELSASRAKRRKVRVGAILRDAQTGAALARVDAKQTSFEHLDVAAAELVAKLRGPLTAAAEERRRRPPADPPPPPPPPAPAPPPATTVPDTRPTAVVYLPVAAHPGPVIVGTLGTTAVVNLLSTLGFRAIISSSSGVAPVEVAAESARRARARATIMLYVYDLEFGSGGVLTARGKLRLIAVSPERRVLFDRYVETDTVVGNRGDTHEALARFVLGQGLEMTRKDLAKVLH